MIGSKANLEAVKDRLQGRPVSRSRAAVMAGAAGIAAAGLVYKLLHSLGR